MGRFLSSLLLNEQDLGTELLRCFGDPNAASVYSVNDDYIILPLLSVFGQESVFARGSLSITTSFFQRAESQRDGRRSRPVVLRMCKGFRRTTRRFQE